MPALPWSGVRGLRWSVMAGLLCVAPISARAQQSIDADFRPTIGEPEYAAGEGPLVLVDRAHHNFHADAEAFGQFARLVREDGYRVLGLRESLSPETLARADVLVIVNAAASPDERQWSLPTLPAFTPDEVETILKWVKDGGSLLLVADHMPFPGAVDQLTRALGLDFLNDFAIAWEDWEPLTFKRADGTLRPHPITEGRETGERVDHAVTFVSGSAFRPLESAGCVAPLLVLGRGIESYQPRHAWRFTETTPRVAVEGWLQGAALEVGRGRVAVFGEAAMFAAQRVGANAAPVGMNSPRASHNLLLLLNTLHWLSRAPEYGTTLKPGC